jgi:mono/diheme cytochrome c family protein
MKKQKIGVLCGFLGLLLAYGCAYNAKDPAPGPTGSTCDTTTKYTFASVDTIFGKAGCEGCHFAGGDLPLLETEANKKAYITGNKDKFVKAIRFEGAHPMPKGGPALASKDIKIIETWICQGAK